LKDSFHLQIVTAGGQPAKNLDAVLEVTPSAVRYDDLNPGYGQQVGVFVASAKTDDMGIVTWMNVPALDEESRLDGLFTVTVGAYTDDTDMTHYLGTRTSYTARTVFFDSASKVITLPYARAAAALDVIASNIDSMVSGVGD